MAAPHANRDFRYVMVPFNIAAASPAVPSFTQTNLASVAGYLLPSESIVTFNQNPRVISSIRADGLRTQSLVNVENNTLGTVPTCTIEMPFTYEVMDIFLGSVFQRVNEATSDPYVKKFQFPHPLVSAPVTYAYPDFSANQGCFFGLVCDGNISSEDDIMTTCIVKEMTLTWNKNNHDGRLWVSMQCEARYYDASASYTGTINVPALEYANFNDLLAVYCFGASMGLYDFSLNLKNNLIWTPTGGVSGYINTNVSLPAFEAKGSIKLEYSDAASKKITINSTSTGNAFSLQTVAVTSPPDDVIADNTILIKGLMQPGKYTVDSTMNSNSLISFDFECIANQTVASVAIQGIEIQMANKTNRGGQWSKFFIDNSP